GRRSADPARAAPPGDQRPAGSVVPRLCDARRRAGRGDEAQGDTVVANRRALRRQHESRAVPVARDPQSERIALRSAETTPGGTALSSAQSLLKLGENRERDRLGRIRANVEADGPPESLAQARRNLAKIREQPVAARARPEHAEKARVERRELC